MTRRHFARTTSIAACFFLSGAESAGCSSTHMDVRSAAADAQFLVDALKCTGSGEFNVTWHGSVPLKQTLNVTEGISLTVTGTDSSRFSKDGYGDTATIDGGSITSQTGIFHVSGASTLTLDNLVLQGGKSTTVGGGGGVEAHGHDHGHPTVNAIDSSFIRNNGSIAGGWTS